MSTIPPGYSPDEDIDFGPTLRGLRPGWKVFERYVLVRKLGQGGMGVVWLAHDEKLALDVALKFLPENLAGDDVAMEDLRAETRRSMRLTHENIVHVYGLESDEFRAAIAMEHVDGRALSSARLEQAGKVFSTDALLPLVRQMCDALTYAHERARIVHHDLKPANLMLTTAGVVKVMDFGIASSLSESMSRHSRAGQATGGGTLPYMSPQQLMGMPASAADDVYALGATLYELLTGKPPFYRGSVEQQIHNVVPPSIAERRAELKIEGVEAVPAVWEQTLAACLEKDADKRPQSVAEVWQRLSGGSADTPVRSVSARQSTASSVKAASSTIAPTRSRKPILLGVAALLIASSAAGWWIKVEAPRRAEVARVKLEQLQEQERVRLADEARQKKEAEDAAESARLAKEKADTEEKQKQMAEAARLAKDKADADATKKAAMPPPAPANDPAIVFRDVIAPILQAKCVRCHNEEKQKGDLRLDAYEHLIKGGETGSAVRLGQAKESLLVSRITLPLDDDVHMPPEGKEQLSAQEVATIRQWVDKPREFPSTTNSPAPAATPATPPKTTMLSATTETPFINSLGMKFVPVPINAGSSKGRHILFSIWETRVRDFEAFVQDSGHDAISDNSFGIPAATLENTKDGKGAEWAQAGGSWREPRFSTAQTGEHPVVCVSYLDAEAFCAWLTKKDRAAGMIPGTASYRLPTDAEWSGACGSTEYPWGESYPPKSSDGNYCGKEAMVGVYLGFSNELVEAGYRDTAARTSAVGMFKANRHGLYDMGGNVWEWCSTWYEASLNDAQTFKAVPLLKDDGGGQTYRVLRGASWGNVERVSLRSSFRNYEDPRNRNGSCGFRVVLVVSGG